jgi:hypothetical protein
MKEMTMISPPRAKVKAKPKTLKFEWASERIFCDSQNHTVPR